MYSDWYFFEKILGLVEIEKGYCTFSKWFSTIHHFFCSDSVSAQTSKTKLSLCEFHYFLKLHRSYVCTLSLLPTTLETLVWNHLVHVATDRNLCVFHSLSSFSLLLVLASLANLTLCCMNALFPPPDTRGELSQLETYEGGPLKMLIPVDT